MEKAAKIELKLSPIIKMVGVTLIVAGVMVFIFKTFSPLPHFNTYSIDSSWVLAVLLHVPQFGIPFTLICFISQGHLTTYGFNLYQKPPIFTHKRMFVLGVVFGLLLSLKYVSPKIRGLPLDVPLPVTAVNVLGNLTFQWIIVGLSEETMFRGLIQTYLIKNLRGSIRILGHSLHVGTVLGAILWGIFHFINLLVMPIGPVLFFVIFTTFAGLAMGYAYQETGSLLTTIIVHNTIFGVPLTIGYILYWLF